MNAIPAILVLGPGGSAVAERIRAALAPAEIHGFSPRLPEAAIGFAATAAHVAGLFAADYGGMVGLGDRVRLAGLSLVAEAVEDGQVVRAALDLDAAPERRDGARLLRRRLRVALHRLRRLFGRSRKV